MIAGGMFLGRNFFSDEGGDYSHLRGIKKG